MSFFFLSPILILAILVLQIVLLNKSNIKNKEIKKNFQELNSKFDELKSELIKVKTLAELKDDSAKINANIPEKIVSKLETPIEKIVEKS